MITKWCEMFPSYGVVSWPSQSAEPSKQPVQSDIHDAPKRKFVMETTQPLKCDIMQNQALIASLKN